MHKGLYAQGAPCLLPTGKDNPPEAVRHILFLLKGRRRELPGSARKVPQTEWEESEAASMVGAEVREGTPGEATPRRPSSGGQGHTLHVPCPLTCQPILQVRTPKL